MAKRSRRIRKQETEKKIQQSNSIPVVAPQAESSKVTAPSRETKETSPPAPAVKRNGVNFSQEYYYVYSELRNVSIIAVLMFTLMFSLGFFI